MGTTGRGLSWSKTVGKKSLGWEHLKVILLLKLPCPQTIARVSYLGLTLPTRSPELPSKQPIHFTIYTSLHIPHIEGISSTGSFRALKGSLGFSFHFKMNTSIQPSCKLLKRDTTSVIKYFPNNSLTCPIHRPMPWNGTCFGIPNNTNNNNNNNNSTFHFTERNSDIPKGS